MQKVLEKMFSRMRKSQVIYKVMTFLNPSEGKAPRELYPIGWQAPSRRAGTWSISAVLKNRWQTQPPWKWGKTKQLNVGFCTSFRILGPEAQGSPHSRASPPRTPSLEVCVKDWGWGVTWGGPHPASSISFKWCKGLNHWEEPHASVQCSGLWGTLSVGQR